MPADLHIHTTASDGRLSPEEVLSKAAKYGLSYIAITDHDTVDGLISIKNNSLKSNLVVIPGIEFSIDLPEHEVHVLGYYIDPFDKQLQEQLLTITDDRRKRIEKIVVRLNAIGYKITYEEILNSTKETSSIGRPNVARVLVEKGYFQTVAQVFEQLLYKNGPVYIPHYKLKPQQAIELINRCGGIPVLAHPGLIGDDNIVLKMIEYGICGLEAFHPKHSKEQRNKYAQLADGYKLLVTGGSDFHGIPSRYPEELGVFTVPDELALSLQRYSQALKYTL
ncbi:Phosphoribosyl 1,2-cyclic phosphate 1,2-diphosphodiesterase [bioreactor metagenome]|uniref:Phosphoribosyl 1,2-cyclic phosphate 1,2-diphosphodiesterase n=1 Tax=bioreactor metagenome TaxID=1076179 RepID=A0A644XV26_9ZZZZ